MYLTLIEDKGMNDKRRHIGLYRCICGIEKLIVIDKVKRGTTKSCGCKTSELISLKNGKHHLSKHPLFQQKQ